MRAASELGRMATALEAVQADIDDLAAQKAALLAQLAQVESRLAQAHACQVETSAL